MAAEKGLDPDQVEFEMGRFFGGVGYKAEEARKINCWHGTDHVGNVTGRNALVDDANDIGFVKTEGHD